MKFSESVRILEQNGFQIIKEKGLPVPKENRNPTVVIQNKRRLETVA